MATGTALIEANISSLRWFVVAPHSTSWLFTGFLDRNRCERLSGAEDPGWIESQFEAGRHGRANSDSLPVSFTTHLSVLSDEASQGSLNSGLVAVSSGKRGSRPIWTGYTDAFGFSASCGLTTLLKALCSELLLCLSPSCTIHSKVSFNRSCNCLSKESSVTEWSLGAPVFCNRHEASAHVSIMSMTLLKAWQSDVTTPLHSWNLFSCSSFVTIVDLIRLSSDSTFSGAQLGSGRMGLKAISESGMRTFLAARCTCVGRGSSTWQMGELLAISPTYKTMKQYQSNNTNSIAVVAFIYNGYGLAMCVWVNWHWTICRRIVQTQTVGCACTVSLRQLQLQPMKPSRMPCRQSGCEQKDCFCWLLLRIAQYQFTYRCKYIKQIATSFCDIHTYSSLICLCLTHGTNKCMWKK